ncbi:hypothetical protein [Citromicrobium sp. JLT1363]|uniref:hypothetical protein n=1 Tax=Citromicrobium sp. JLT1363 TaxID=517722 RepID=UPI000225E038|nr:hypothetical protein [Citromicrobium sp. JLT1363]
MKRKAAAIPALALVLLACGGGEEKADPASDETVGPQGEVQGGTISDAMLPIATVRSQAPRRGGDSDESAGEERDDAE